jgi:lipopolysaccharide transport system permease protein
MLRNLSELHQYRALLWSLTVRELRARYRASVLGFLWTFVNPTLSMVVYAFAFTVVMPQQRIDHYPYFIFVGLLPWLFFSSSVVAGASAVSDRRDLLTKVRFPAQVLPATVVCSNLANYLLTLPLLLALGMLSGVMPSWHIVYFVPLVALQTLFTLGVTYLLSALNVAFRDLQHIAPNVLQMVFFLTPVLYPTSWVPQPWQRWALLCNPMAAFMESYRDIFYMHMRPPFIPLGVVTALSLVLLWVSSSVFERRREEFAELV